MDKGKGGLGVGEEVGVDVVDCSDRFGGEGNGGFTGGGDASFGEEDDPVGVGNGEVEVVEDGAGAKAVVLNQFADGAEEGVLVAEVEGCGGLVEEEPGGGRGLPVLEVELGEDAGEVDALAFPAGEGGIAPVAHGEELDGGKGGLAGIPVLWGFPSAEVGDPAEEDDLLDGEVELKEGMLGHDGPPTGEDSGGVIGEGLAVEEDGAGIGLEGAGEDAEEGGLAGAVGAEDDGELTGLQFEIDGVENGAGATGEADLFGGKHPKKRCGGGVG